MCREDTFRKSLYVITIAETRREAEIMLKEQQDSLKRMWRPIDNYVSRYKTKYYDTAGEGEMIAISIW